jgi:hypothetical protein
MSDMKTKAVNEIGIMKKAFADALAKIKIEEPPAIQRSSFAKAYRTELKALRRNNYAAERVVELYVQNAISMENMTKEVVERYRAMLIDVIDVLEPGWFLTKPGRKRSQPAVTVKSKGEVASSGGIATTDVIEAQDEDGNGVAAQTEAGDTSPSDGQDDEPI